MRAALTTLCALDADLAAIEPRCGALPWRRRPPGFPGLLQAITAQQISNQAAHAIWTRLRALPGALTPQGLLMLDDDALRGAGLSRRRSPTRARWPRPAPAVGWTWMPSPA